MPEIIGTVQCVRVAQDSAFVCLSEQNASTNELFILWWDGFSNPDNPPASLRIVQSNWVALLRQAMASSIQVTITHGDGSAYVENVQLGLEP